MRGVGRNAVGAKLEHPSSVAFGDTFSHKGRRGILTGGASNWPSQFFWRV
jgi:hypothetical protein